MTHFTQNRRFFLQSSATLLAAGPPLLSNLAHASAVNPVAKGQPFPGRVTLPTTPQEQPAKDSLGIAIVGLGYYALGLMMPAFAKTKQCHIAAVVSGNAQKAARVANAYGLPEDAVYSYETFDQIAADDRVDAVYIVLPSGLHASWTEKAFAAGKHVLCEKPMALSTAECDRMILASQKAQKKLMIAYRCHFDPFNLQAMSLIREGAIGQIEQVETAHQYTMGPTSPAQNWRAKRALAGGGALEDYGVYGVQAALYMTNEMPETISAKIDTGGNDPRFEEIVAGVRAEMTFPSGAKAVINTSYNAPGDNSIMTKGSNGSLTMRPATSYSGHKMNLETGKTSKIIATPDPEEQFHAQLSHFATCIKNDLPIKTGGEMGRRDVQLMEAIYKAGATGKTIRL